MELIIDTAASGDTTLLAASSGYIYRVRQLFLVAAVAVAVKFKSGANSLTGAMTIATNGQLILQYQALPWMTTNNNEAFVINLGAAIQVGGRIVIDKVPV